MIAKIITIIGGYRIINKSKYANGLPCSNAKAILIIVFFKNERVRICTSQEGMLFAIVPGFSLGLPLLPVFTYSTTARCHSLSAVVSATIIIPMKTPAHTAGISHHHGIIRPHLPRVPALQAEDRGG